MHTFLLLTLALAFYNVGTIWAMEVDIFRSWKWVGEDFHRVQTIHWHKLPYWVFAPVGLQYVATVALIWYRSPRMPLWGIVIALGAQTLSHILTAIMWGRWQAALSQDPAGAKSVYLQRILRTHWLRTFLITLAGVALLVTAVPS